MNRTLTFLTCGLLAAVVLSLHGEPTPSPSPKIIRRGRPTPAPEGARVIAPAPAPRVPAANATPPPPMPKLQVPTATPAASVPKKIQAPQPTPKPTAPKNIAPGVTPAPSVPKIKAPGVTPTPTAPKDIAPKPTATPKKKLVPGPQDWKNGGGGVGPVGPKDIGPAKAPFTPAPTAPPLKGPADKGPDGKGKGGHGSKWKGKGGWNVWINIDVNPPPPSVIYVPAPPVYQSVQRSEVVYAPGGIAAVPEDYTPPAEGPAQAGPTALRAWNGDPAPETRKFDQTRITVAPALDSTLSWQFFWQTTSAEPQAARWEVATVPFVNGVDTFPPAGLVAYGDASLDAEIPAMANFFAVDFGALTKGLEDAPPLTQVYMRVVPVDGEGKPVVAPSNFVRVDLPQ